MTVATRRRRRARTLSKLARVMREQGRKYTWLSDKTGYSISTIGAVARGQRLGSTAFYKVASYALGEDVSP